MQIVLPTSQQFITEIIMLESCSSTNDYCAEILNQLPESKGVVVVTMQQTAGRGQRGNSWEAAKGQNITLSIGIQPADLLASNQFYLNKAISLALYSYLQNKHLDPLTVKWPNDMLVGDEKVAGILIENTIMASRISKAVIGIGLNVNQREFLAPRASSLARLCGKSFDVGEEIQLLLKHVCNYLDLLHNSEYRLLSQKYVQVLYRIGTWANYRVGDSSLFACIEGVNEQGQLMLQTEAGLQSFNFKEIEYLY